MQTKLTYRYVSRWRCIGNQLFVEHNPSRDVNAFLWRDYYSIPRNINLLVYSSTTFSCQKLRIPGGCVSFVSAFFESRFRFRREFWGFVFVLVVSFFGSRFRFRRRFGGFVFAFFPLGFVFCCESFCFFFG